MSTEQRNIATVTELFENLGPGIDHWKAANRAALAEDHVWWIQGWPAVVGMEEHDALLDLLEGAFGIVANPILEWRAIDASGNKVFMERRGSFADARGDTISSWDIMGVYTFNENGTIQLLRDYYDGGDSFDVFKRVLPAEQIDYLRSQSVHPLTAGYRPQAGFYRSMVQRLTAARS